MQQPAIPFLLLYRLRLHQACRRSGSEEGLDFNFADGDYRRLGQCRKAEEISVALDGDAYIRRGLSDATLGTRLCRLTLSFADRKFFLGDFERQRRDSFFIGKFL